MKVEYLPEKQEANNKRVNRASRALFGVLLLLIICPLLVAAWLYFEGVSPVPIPQCLGPDHASVLGDAIILSSDFVLCPADCPDGSILAIPHEDPKLLLKVRTDELAPGSKVTLMRSQSPLASELVHPSSDVENGERAFTASSQNAWEGNVIEQGGSFVMQPALPMGGVAPVYAKADAAFIGIAVQRNGDSVLVPVRELRKRFAELDR